MRIGTRHHSILQVCRCRIQSVLHLQSASVGCFRCKTFCLLIHSRGSGSEFEVLDKNDFEYTKEAVNGIPILRSLPTRTGERIRDTASNVANNLRHEFLDETVKERTTSKSLLSSFRSIQICDGQKKMMESQNSRNIVKVFVLDVETTGFCRQRGRIIEIAIRDLSGGENSCFQTLVNPGQVVPNSKIHGITTNMVNHQDVPRMRDLIPILTQYIGSRLSPGGLALFIAHNGRCFDFPFLINEFRRCLVDIPSNWLFLDTLPLARELMRSNGSKLSSGISLEALREYYEIPLVSSNHRAVTDVNLLALIFGRMTFDLKLVVSDLLERSSTASDMINSKKSAKKG